MKVLVRIDQVTALAEGIDAPNSTAKVEFDPAALNPDQRKFASDLFAQRKDNWADIITVLNPTVDELKAGLDKLIEAKREDESRLEARRALLAREDVKIEGFAKALLKRVLARDPSLLKAGSASVSGYDMYSNSLNVDYQGHYILVDGYSPEGTSKGEYAHGPQRTKLSFCCNGEKERSDEELKKVAMDHPLLLEAFEAWQAELDAATDKAREAAETELEGKREALRQEAADFITKHGSKADRLRLKEVCASKDLVMQVLEQMLLKDYPGAVLGKEHTMTDLGLHKLSDDALERYVHIRDTKVIEGDSVYLVASREMKSEAFAQIVRIKTGPAVGLMAFVLIPLQETAPAPKTKTAAKRKEKLATVS